MRRLLSATAAGVMLLSAMPARGAIPAQAAVPATTTGAHPPAQDDPWEHFNRRVYRLNQRVDRSVIRPVAIGYSRLLPKPLRLAIHHVLGNLGEPNIIINDALQLRLTRALRSTGRLVVNSTFGVAGLFDVAAGAGLPHEPNSFSTTLGRYGVPAGPYLYLPIMGPSSVRGAVGSGVDGALNPLYWAPYAQRTTVAVSTAVVGGLDLRVEADEPLKALVGDAIDPYATLRSAYLQNQQSLIDGDTIPLNSLPDFDEAPVPPASSPAPATGGGPSN
jgi:phospholipid-binding lipoprotein MlaA